MSVLSNLAMGLEAISPMVILFAAIGALIGTAIGVLPGLGPAATIGLLLPITFGMNPLWAMSMLCGIHFGSMYGSSTIAILMKIPGETAPTITCLDGYEMAQKGRAGQALAICAIGSFIAGTFGTLMLMMIGGPVSRVAVNFGPAEYTVLMLAGLALASGLGNSKLKAFIMCTVGLMLSTVGTDSFSGISRFTFGLLRLEQGFETVPVLMGMIAMSYIFIELENGIRDNPLLMSISTKFRNLLPSRSEMKRSAGPMARGSVLGFFLSILPGIDASISSFMSYITEKKLSRHPEKFGTGMIEGVAGPESANNAAVSGNLVPLLTLGIPCTATMAVLASGLMMYGLTPGPMLFRENPGFVYGLIVTMFISNIMLVIINLPLVGIWVRLLKFPVCYLYPLIFMFVIIGGYAINFSSFDLFIICVFAVLGYFAVKLDFPVAPLILGLFLGSKVESSFRQAMLVSRGSLDIFIERPIAVGLLAFALAVLAGVPVIRRIYRKRVSA